ncbi:hypothetical protein THIX_60798 [Thiomonas sp. X19]|nr:hypothetical protein THIX_60798 [Thiomonas sp. X19]
MNHFFLALSLTHALSTSTRHEFLVQDQNLHKRENDCANKQPHSWFNSGSLNEPNNNHKEIGHQSQTIAASHCKN